MNFFLTQKNRILIPAGIILTGFFLRLYSLQHTYAINPDGMLYIQQAKAFHYGQYESLTTCYPYLNSLFIYISLCYRIFGDWLVAAKVVSLFFSTITMVPLYLLLRRFLEFSVASLTLLVFAVNPILIEISGKIIRDPSFWFFFTLGIYIFTLLDFRKIYFVLPLSCLSFLVAALARFEAIVFIFTTVVFLLLTAQEKKWEKIGYFLAPAFFAFLLVLCSLTLMNFDLKQWFYPRSLVTPFILFFEKYEQLQEVLANTWHRDPALFWTRYFFSATSNLIWWLGLGAVVVEIIRTFFEPFFLFYFFGLKGIRERIKKDSMLFYLLLLSISTFLVLYIHEIGNWTMRGRFAVFFLIPTFVVIGFGIENLLIIWGDSKRVKKIYLLLILGLTIFLIPLPKNMHENRENSKILQEIGTEISAIENSRREVRTAAAFDEADIKFISFFANLLVNDVSCVSSLSRKIDPHFVFENGYLRENEISYLVWDEQNWPLADLERLKKGNEISCTEIKEWQDRSRGRLVLFKIQE